MRPGERFVARDERDVEQLGKGDVHGVVGAYVVAELPGALEQGDVWVAAQWEIREVESICLGDSGFHLSTAGYGGWADFYHGAWKGSLHVEGDYVADCLADPGIGRVRDRPVALRSGDDVGQGIHEHFYAGAWPEFGMDADVPDGKIT